MKDEYEISMEDSYDRYRNISFHHPIRIHGASTYFNRRRVPSRQGKVCHIWRGFLGGVVQAILESLGKTGEIKSEKTKCMAHGDPYCEIQITVTPTA